MPPTAPSEPTTRSCKGPVGLPDDVPRPPAGAALGDRHRARHPRQRAGRQDQRGDVHDAARAGATLARALCQFALDRNADAFEEIRPPTLVTTATLTATGQLPKFADDAYRHRARRPVVHPDRRGAADVDLRRRGRRARASCRCGSWRTRRATAARPARPVATPAACCARTSSTRSRSSPYATPEQAPDLLAEMTGRAEALIAGLGLPYRIIEICTGDLGQSHHRSFDIEVYAPGCDAWLEVVVGLAGSATTRRGAADIRYRGRRARRARRSLTRSTARRSPCHGCGQRSSRTIASPTARSSCPTCCIHTCGVSSGSRRR